MKANASRFLPFYLADPVTSTVDDLSGMLA